MPTTNAMPMPKPKKDLGKKIKATSGNAPVPVKAAPVPATAPVPMPQAAKPASVTTGRPAAVWFDDEDRGILRHLSMVLLPQGITPTHSLIVRALLRLATTDEHNRLIDKCRELIEQDGRKRRFRKPDGQAA